MRLSSFLLFCSSSLFLLCLSLSLLTDEWSFLPCNPNTSQTPREAKVSHLVMMWYGPLLFVHFSVCFHSFPVLCTYTFCDVLPLAYSSFFLFLFFLFVGGNTSSHNWWDSGERSDDSSLCCSPMSGK